MTEPKNAQTNAPTAAAAALSALHGGEPRPLVYFLGVGPGDPGLMTYKLSLIHI